MRHRPAFRGALIQDNARPFRDHLGVPHLYHRGQQHRNLRVSTVLRVAEVPYMVSSIERLWCLRVA